MRRIIIHFGNFPDAHLDILAQSVVINCKPDADFNMPELGITDVETASKDFTSSMANSPVGTRAQASKKKPARATLEVAMHKFASGVNFKYEGNLPILLKTGIPLVSERSDKPTPMAENLKVKYIEGESGSVLASINSVNGKKILFGCAPAKNAPENKELWRLTYSSSRKAIIKGLPKGEDWLFTATVVGKPGESYKWCPPIPILIV